MSKLALLIAPNLNPNGSSSEADARALANALERYWNFDPSEIVLMTSQGEAELRATRSNVANQLNHAREHGRLDSLLIGFWGEAEVAPEDRKRRFRMADYDPDNVASTTISLPTIMKAALRLGANDACVLLDFRPVNEDGEPWVVDEEDVKTISNFVHRSEPGMRVAALTCCSAGERPLDLEEGKSGLFTRTFIEGMHENARHFQGSFDSVAGYVVQHTERKSRELGGRQFPFFVTVGEGDIGFKITPSFDVDSQIDWDAIYGRTPDAFAEEEIPEGPKAPRSEPIEPDELDKDSLLIPNDEDAPRVAKNASISMWAIATIVALGLVALALGGAIAYVWTR